ncbi:MAG: DUF1801 domain-containing protein [Pseudomonadota bacterium]
MPAPRRHVSAMAGNKTKPTLEDPRAFIAGIAHDTRRADAERLLVIFHEVTGLAPQMWGDTLIGYGRYHYKYESGREGDMLMTGFSPRKSSLSLYVMPGYERPEMAERLARLGKHKLGKACLYINKLADVDEGVLREIIAAGVADVRARYETWDA